MCPFISCRLSIPLSDIRTQMDASGIDISKTSIYTNTVESPAKNEKQKKNKLSLRGQKKHTTNKKNVRNSYIF